MSDLYGLGLLLNPYFFSIFALNTNIKIINNNEKQVHYDCLR